MIRPRIARVAMLLVMLASVFGTATVSAAAKSTNVTNVWGTIGVWGTYTDFYSRWQQTFTGVWSFDDFEITARVRTGMDCNPNNRCQAWAFTGDMKFYNSSNVQVGSTIGPVNGFCYSQASDPRDRLFGRCKYDPFGVSPTATYVKITWGVWIMVSGQWGQIWSATKTVTL